MGNKLKQRTNFAFLAFLAWMAFLALIAVTN